MENNKYQQGKIYKIVCNITGEIYIGSTIDTLEKRLSNHKVKTKRPCKSKQILDRGDYKIELIKDYPCNSLYELEEEEAKYIRNNTCINIQIPHRTYEEWREDNKEKLSQQQKNWREDNKEKLSQQQKNWREDNKEKIKEYYEENKKEINKKKSEKITCECGALVSKQNLSRHKKTMKHIKLTECIIID